MTALVDIIPGANALSTHVQQLIDQWTGRRNAPASLLVTDPIAYGLTIRNADPGSRDAIFYAADGVTVLFKVDATGVTVSPDGTAAVAPLTSVGPGGAQVAVGNHVHGAGGYAGTGAVTLEGLYAGATVVTAVNYVVATAVLFVFCTTGVQVTLPAAATSNRPITVASVAGSQTVIAAAGSVIGGSVNTSTGAIMNGVVSAGEAITWKSDLTNWRAV